MKKSDSESEHSVVARSTNMNTAEREKRYFGTGEGNARECVAVNDKRGSSLQVSLHLGHELPPVRREEQVGLLFPVADYIRKASNLVEDETSTRRALEVFA